MGGFPKGLAVLLVDCECDGPAAQALRNPELAYCVTAVTSLAAAQASFAGGAVAYDCVVCEHALLQAAPPSAALAFFRAAAAVHAPVVLMGESPSQAAVLQGVHWGAADFLERPLSMLKLRTLWQHKIRKMMERGNGGVLPRRPSCPQLPSATPSTSDSPALPSKPHALMMMPRCASLAALTCPATPSLRTASLAAPQPSSSLASGDSSCQQAQQQQQPGSSGDCGDAALPAAAAADRSDATSGLPRAQLPACFVPAPAPAPSAAPAPTPAPAPAGPAAPLACMRLGAAGDALPAAVVHWPVLPSGTTWGTPVGCGVPPPPLPGSAGAGEGVSAGSARAPDSAASPGAAAAAFPHPSIKWCPPGSLPLPASTYDLLLPENFSLAQAAAEVASTTGAGARGPLGLRLTVTPDLLASFNASLQAHQQQQQQQLYQATLAPPPCLCNLGEHQQA